VVRNHQVLYVDLIGTCFDVLTKPMPLMQRHVDIYRHKVIMGMHNRVRRDKNGDLKNSPRIQVDGTGSEENHSTMLSGNELEINHEIPIDDPTQVVLHKEMFIDITRDNQQLRFSQDFVDFNFAESGRISESKQLTVQNKYPFSITITWALLNVLNKTTGLWVKNPFRIRPEIQRVDANSTFTFNIDFAPYEPDQYFFQLAQCFV
jgi:hypothetical protein